ncbi:protein RUFY3 isoform X1 [Gadus morhua]|uniref:Protein RUFY3 n=1 Tax=Gadus morhua TaxID=8049 RepID=A0A8C5AK18_GADMO|nr:protein RUFY3 isoform X1 [Gadus morhua]XP_056448060.1 protein RUFY3-like isoform X1 [Gadus chalcogrammus]XP_056448162.1 protein RUFY3-like isoform X1 [Gadus chalcogrammus]
MAAEGDTKPKELNLQPSESLSASGHTKCQDGNNGLVVDSPEETFSPTSVIFFKEALNSCNLSFGGSVSPTPVRQYEFHIERKKSKNPKDPIAIERLNLMNMAKLSIKGLIESALNLGRTLDSDYAPLQQFFVVMEHCLKHGLKTKKTFLGQNKSFWGALELVEKLTPEAGEITASVKDLPGLKTPLGRGRAWLRLALMQKKLSDYMKTIINRKDLLSEFYEANALMMEEEGAVIAGLLVGLNVIDANLCMKGEDLDSQVGVIDFSMYLKDSGNSSKSTEGDGQITAILDQKNYVEELNRHLSASVNNLQAKVDVLEKSNTKLTEELAVANNRIITLQEDVERVKEESSYQMESNRKALRSDAAVPVATDGQSLGETRKQLKEETLLRLDVEKELEVQIGMKQEMELSMKMLEKDVCEKQDALVELRTQMEDIRTFNQQLTHKAQSSEASSKQKGDIITGLEDKINQMAGTVKQLESRSKQAQRERDLAQEANRLFKQEFGDKIESLQTEVEHLRKQRYKLDLELRRERARKSDQPFGTQPTVPSVPQKGRPHTEQAVTRHSLKVNVPDSEKAQEDASEDKTAEGSPTPSSECEDVKEKSVLELSQLSICTICEQEESLTRIKKRCKNCSGVFCESCLTNELPLPSSILPENVCDTCYFLLLQQYASSPT